MEIIHLPEIYNHLREFYNTYTSDLFTGLQTRQAGNTLWLPPLNLDDSLISCPTLGNVANWKNDIPFFTKLMATKLGRVVISRRVSSKPNQMTL